jgi:hypothetical protein
MRMKFIAVILASGCLLGFQTASMAQNEESNTPPAAAKPLESATPTKTTPSQQDKAKANSMGAPTSVPGGGRDD